MEFSEIIIGSLLVGLFVFAFISFGVTFANQNDLNQTIVGTRNVSTLYNKLNSTLNQASDNATSQKDALIGEGSNPTTVVSVFGFIFRSIINAANIFINIGIGMTGQVFATIAETLGIPPIVSGVIMAILLIAIIFTMHRMWKGFST